MIHIVEIISYPTAQFFSAAQPAEKISGAGLAWVASIATFAAFLSCSELRQGFGFALVTFHEIV